MKYCPECGNKIEGNPKFCPECGNKLSIEEKSKEPKSARVKYIEALMRGESENSARTRAGFLTEEEKIIKKTIKEATYIDPIEEELPDEFLTTKTQRKCPTHSCNLYDTRHDGLWYYCPKCKKQYHTNWIL